MKLRTYAASLALLLSLLPSSGYSQASTPPVGVILYKLTSGTTTPIGVPVFSDVAFRGTASTVTANTLSTTDATFMAGEFAQIGAPYFVLVLSGGQTGRLLLVTGNTANTVTVDVGATNLTGDATTPSFAAALGDRFEIFPGDTISTLFGDGSVNNPVLLQKGAFVFTADTVQIFNGVKWVSYFFNQTNNFWCASTSPDTNANTLVIPPDAGLLIGRRGATATISITGRAPTTNLATRFVGNATSAVAVRFPKDTTLAELNFSGPGTWSANDNPFVADKVSLFNGVRWVAYYQTAASVWKQVGGDNSDQGAKAIPAGSCVLIQKQGAATNSASFFTQMIPYSAN